MNYLTQRELLDEMRPLIDRLKMVPDNSPEAKALVRRLTDLRIAVEATNRHDLFSPSPIKENSNPSAGDYWIDTPRSRDELYFSAIVEKLSGVSREDLVMLVAALLIGNVGFVEASIERLSWQAKKNGKIKLPDGRKATPNSIRDILSNDSLHAALSRIAKLNEVMLIGKQRARRKPGGSHPPSKETLVKKLEKWILKQWNSQAWASQDAFIKKMKEIAPPEKAETLGIMQVRDIKLWLPSKKKKSHKNN